MNDYTFFNGWPFLFYEENTQYDDDEDGNEYEDIFVLQYNKWGEGSFRSSQANRGPM